MFSNNLDALPLRDVNERRIYAMRGASRPLNNEEIDEIINWKKDELNISALFKYLKTYPVDEGNFKRAPKTLTKVQIVNATVGVGGADLDNWLNEQAPEVFDYEYAAEALDTFSEDIAAVGMSRDRFRRLLMDKGYHSVQIRIDSRTRKYVYYHPDKTPSDAGKLRELYGKIA